MDHHKLAEEYANKIKALKDSIEKLAQPFRVDPETGKDLAFDKYSPDHWCRNTYGNALIRLCQLVENNFICIEMMGLLSVARYIFELSIWLLLFKKDVRYGLIYYRELLNTQHKYYEDTQAHLLREIELLKIFEKRDKEASEQVLQNHKMVKTAEEYGEIIRNAMNRVDAEAGRHFAIYLDAAKTNGYSFQAYLLENQAVPQVDDVIKQIKNEIQEYEKIIPNEVKNLVKGRWQWRTMSEKAGILNEYDYIYSYASKLLHATPASLTTDQKNLEMEEVCIFLRYIYVKILDIMNMAWSQPECKINLLT